MNLKKILFLFCFFIFFKSYCQTNNFSEIEIINKYVTANPNDINEIKKLYLYSKSKFYKKGILVGLLEMQKYYLKTGHYFISLQFSHSAEDLAIRMKDNIALSSIYLCRAQASSILHFYNEAKQNLHKSLFFGNRISNQTEKHLQLSTVYSNFAGVYDGNDNANDSISYYLQKSLDIIESTPTNKLTELQKRNYYNILMTGYMNMGILYTYILQPAKLDKAEPYFKKVLEFSEKEPKYFEPSDFETYKAIGVFYNKKKDYKRSFEYFEKALQIEKHKNNPKMRLVIYKELKDSYESLGNISRQNQYLKLYSNLNDSINKIDKDSIIENSRLHIKQSIENAKQSHEESLRKVLIFSILFLTLTLVAMWVFFQKGNRKSADNNVIIYQLKKQPEELILTEENLNFDFEEDLDHKSKVNISTDTERKLLKKLAAFEASERFLRKDLSLTSMSHQKNTNPKYLSEIIRIHKNNNFNGYINSLRIKYIMRKLNTDIKYREYKISYLAEECGYTSSQVFVIAFKKETGVTPSHYIENLKDDTVKN